MNLGLGVDTGGTYTDSVIVDLQSGRVLCKSKALTKRNELSIGILESIRGLDASLFKKIRLVSVSSTLATNSVVEGKGCRVGLIIIGHELNIAVPVDECLEIRGGHNLKGMQKAELDLASAKEFVLEVKDRVDAFAVSGYMSVRNPEHEKAVKGMLLTLTPLPVVCGHELSTDLGLRERTTSAVLNARLIPIVTELLSSVTMVLGSCGINALLMIVRGDGSLMGELIARERPVETILSGPAASLIGAKCLTAMEDAVVIDVGGTTTDIGLLRKGRPRLSPAGATVGGWKTRVRAADIATSGIGGDSRVVVYDGKVHITPLRVVPLCIAASMYPVLSEKLKLAKEKPVRSQLSCSDIADLHQVNEFFVLGREIKGVTVGADEKTLLDLVREEPRSIYEVKEITGLSIHAFDIRKLEELGMIQRIGMTPTDALHAEGSYVQYDPSPSVIGVEILSRSARMEPSEFCREVRRQVIDKITLEVLDKLVYDENGHSKYCEVASNLLRKLAKVENGGEYSCSLSLRKAIVGIGAPAGAYLPSVAERLGTGLILPEHMEVGNAIGAITGSIVESVDMLIVPKAGMSTLRNPPSYLHFSGGKMEFTTYQEAREYATKVGTDIATERAMLSGAEKIEVEIESEDTRVKLGKISDETVLVESRIKVTAVGKPRLVLDESTE